MTAAGARVEQGTVASQFLDATAACVTPLESAWEFGEIRAGSSIERAAILAPGWRQATVPGTVAGALRSFGELDEERGNDLDAREFLYRTRFTSGTAGGDASLVLEGLATLADVWLNGQRILGTRNMFRRHEVPVGPMLREDNELLLHFRALAPELARKRPRPRWTTRLVEERNLRFLRTTLLGRMPGWAPPHPPLGPWRGIRLVQGRRVVLRRVQVRPSLVGGEGVLAVAVAGRVVSGDVPSTLEVRFQDRTHELAVIPAQAEFSAEGEVRVGRTEPWWTHDCGTPARHDVGLALVAGACRHELGSVRVGFRRIEQTGGSDGGFGLRLNGRDLFCRGACWTPADVVGLREDPAEIRRVVGLARDAGMNMLRLSGTMLYGSDAFYEACDEMGVLVWQDLMFASMEYPEEDPEFAEETRIEVGQLAERLHHRPSLAVVCGNSEVEQQAAMKGLAPDAGRTPLFETVLRDLVVGVCPGALYVRSSPSGGAMPFHADTGVAHYFGVGAYLRPAEDARASRVRFASECLAFSNVPDEDVLLHCFGEDANRTHTPRWRRGVPRDGGAGWDFGDVTDHYVERLFSVDVRALRSSDPARYLALARVVPGELMERALGAWRAEGSLCRGALIWFLRDLRPGAGWGLLDSAGSPKAAYGAVRRACAPRTLWITDEGLNGLRIHVRNDRPEALEGLVRVRLVRADGIEIEASESRLSLGGGSSAVLGVDAMLGRFADTAYAYRFGPCEHAVTVAELVGNDGSVIAASHHLPGGLAHVLRESVGLKARVAPRGDGSFDVRVSSQELALYVRVAAAGFSASDDAFHIAPRGVREIVLAPRGGGGAPQCRISALNSRAGAEIEMRTVPV